MSFSVFSYALMVLKLKYLWCGLIGKTRFFSVFLPVDGFVAPVESEQRV